MVLHSWASASAAIKLTVANEMDFCQKDGTQRQQQPHQAAIFCRVDMNQLAVGQATVSISRARIFCGSAHNLQ